MKTSIKITKPEIFEARGVDVNTTGLSCDFDVIRNSTTFKGSISIECDDHGWEHWTGEHGAGDYEAEYGFVLTSD